MNDTSLQGILVSLTQKGLVALGMFVSTYFGLDQGSVVTGLVGLAPIIVGVVWGVYTKIGAHKVEVAANAAGMSIPLLKQGTVAEAKMSGLSAAR